MHRFAIAAASLIAATVSIGGCEQKPDRQPDPEALATVAVPAPEPERTEYSTLLELCESGDATPERVQAFLDLRVDVNAKSEEGATPLHVAAAKNENPEVLTTLIVAGADVNAKTDFGITPQDSAMGKNAEVLRAAGGKPGKDLP
ncbi:MAG: ankyrin repeat domain-containing protein [Phycisphaerales bacterium]|nr:ankyrin repeat domain-containing protein [Phycisphaerales bacterium]